MNVVIQQLKEHKATLDQTVANEMAWVRDTVLAGYPERYANLHAEPAEYTLLGESHRYRGIAHVLVFNMLADERTLNNYLKQAYGIAAAIEMIHTGTILIDDSNIFDGGERRKDERAARLVHGEGRAAMGGEGLRYWGQQVMEKHAISMVNRSGAADLTQALYATLDKLAMGQLMDDQIDKTDHDLRTGLYYKNSLFEFALESPSIYLREPGKGKHLQRAGALLSLAYQYWDDLRDVLQKESAVGKDVQKDKDNSINHFGVEGVQGRLRRITQEAIQEIRAVQTNTILEQLIPIMISKEKPF